MKLFRKQHEEEEVEIGMPHSDHRCLQCGGYEDCDETFMNRFTRLSATGELPQAEYPSLPCPFCQEVH